MLEYKQTQNDFVLSHLVMHGYITDIVARNYGVRRLASRIYDIKKIRRVNKELRRDDAGVRYAYYTLA